MSPKDELLNRAAQEYKAFYQALDGLNEADLTEVWLRAWSIKEIVAHMVGWHRELIPALQRIARGERPFAGEVRYDDVDAWNARFADGVRDRPVEDVLLDFDKSHEAFLRAAAGVPEARYEPGRTAYTLVDLNSAHHYREHGDQIRAWRAARGL